MAKTLKFETAKAFLEQARCLLWCQRRVSSCRLMDPTHTSNSPEYLQATSRRSPFIKTSLLSRLATLRLARPA